MVGNSSPRGRSCSLVVCPTQSVSPVAMSLMSNCPIVLHIEQTNTAAAAAAAVAGGGDGSDGDDDDDVIT